MSSNAKHNNPKGNAMSLEAALQEHTAVMRELLARLTAGSLTAVAMTGTEYVAKIDAEAAEQPAAKPTTAAEAVAQAKASAAAAAKAQETTSTAEATAALDYEKDVRPALVKVSTGKGRDALVALLAKFNVTKGDQLQPAQLADVLAAANELLGA